MLAAEGRAIDLVHTDGSAKALCTSFMLKENNIEVESASVHTGGAIGIFSQLKKPTNNIIRIGTTFIKQITRPNLPQELTSMMM